ncbi:MAG: carboxypeptidase regulatory-like domain-containing protein [Nanoarchaeota archaeon]|nr:carboxypeptidase regulatory-like domain-containing protein [Nanoarchaeota archaeon]
MKNKIIKLIASLFFIMIILSFVSAVPEFMFLKGSVKIDSEPAPLGTILNFSINGTQVANTTVNALGEYSVTISGYNELRGEPISINVNNYQATQIINYNFLDNSDLNISILVTPRSYIFIAYNSFEGYEGNLSKYGGADAICNADVPIFENFRPTNGTYKAYVSKDGNYPGNILGFNLSRPIYRTSANGFEIPKKIADNLSQLENGKLNDSILAWSSSYVNVWTGIKASRTEERDCNDWTTNNSFGYYGDGLGYYRDGTSNNYSGWANVGFTWGSCSQKKGVYCIGPVDIEVKGYCGDGILETGESCDDGNFNTNDACVNCQIAKCGDGYVKTGYEECDDKNNFNRDGCENDCTNTGYFMFATSKNYTGNLGGIAGANAKCNSDLNNPNSSKMAGIYKAYIRADKEYNGFPDLGLLNTSYPIYRTLDEKKIANNLADLQDGTTILPITNIFKSSWLGGGGLDCTGWTTSEYPPIDYAHEGYITNPYTTYFTNNGYIGCSEAIGTPNILCIGPFDSSPLDVKINIPEKKSFSSKIVNINVTTDFNADYCTYKFNNEMSGDLNFVTNNLFVKTIDMGQDGSYKLNVTCYIAAQPERTTSVARNFYVDSVSPFMISFSPPGIVYSKNVSIKAVFSDIINSSDYYLGIDDVDYTSLTILKNTGDVLSGVGELTISKIFSDSGNHIVKTRVKDKAGHLLESTFSFTIDVWGKLSGYIFNEYGNAIGDVNVTIKDKQTGNLVSSVKSDSNGIYNLELIEGNYSVNISKYGYIDNSFDVYINGQSDTKQNISLFKPEIVLQNLSLSKNLVEGQNISVSAILLNTENYNLTLITYELYVNNTLKETKITNLLGHSNKIVNFNFIAEPGNQVVKIKSNIPEQEINLTNNFVEKNISIDLFSDNILLNNLTLYQVPSFNTTNRVNNGNQFVVSTSVKNSEFPPLYNVPASLKIVKSIDNTLSFNLSNDYGYKMSNPQIINITSGGTTYIEWLVNATAPAGLGEYYISVSLDNRTSTNPLRLVIV